MRVEGRTESSGAPNAGGRSGRDPHHFVVGCARSGTTLLHRIVDAHPRVAVTPEMHWISNHFGGTGAGRRVTREALRELAAHRRFLHFELDRADFETLLGPDESVTFREFARRLFDLYGRSREKPVVGNKTPAYVRHVGELHALWPRARFVHIVRDGRDVCLSVLNWKKADRIVGKYVTGEHDPVSTVALWWEQNVRSGHAAGARLGPNLYHVMRYKDLIGHPEAQCRALCAFLGFPYEAAMLRFSDEEIRAGLPSPRRNINNALLPVTPGLRDWRAEMERGSVERFEAVAGDLLEDFGFERAFPEPSREAREHAARMRAAFERDLQVRAEDS